MTKERFLEYVRNGITTDGFSPYVVFWEGNASGSGSMLAINTNRPDLVPLFVADLRNRGVKKIFYAMDHAPALDIENRFVVIHLYTEGKLETRIIEYDENGVVGERRSGLALQELSINAVAFMSGSKFARLN